MAIRILNKGEKMTNKHTPRHTTQDSKAGGVGQRPASPWNVMAIAIAFAAGAGNACAAFDIPTGAGPSPLFGATPFSQQMLRFEEFGTRPLPQSEPAPHFLPDSGMCIGPSPSDTTNPGSMWNTRLDTFLGQALSPAPQRTANTAYPNPWAATISGCLGRPVSGVIEGRPPGEDFAHQRWDEFLPQVYVQTAQAGARVNGGLRDQVQLHRYQFGEFGPGGLYHNTAGVPGLDGTTKGIQVKFHPKMPIQDPQALWTFDGTLPPKLLMAPYESTILLRHYNALPVSAAANKGFGEHTITTHEHNGHNPGESDGFAGAYFFPGEFYDYRWPMVLAGHDTINTDQSDPRTGTPTCADPRPDACATPGGIRRIAGDWRETMSTHWIHDHMLDATAQNVYKGNVAMMNYYSAVDRGREPASLAEAQGNTGYGCNYASPDNANLCFPSGSDLDWGNRSYDINLVIVDKAFDAAGQLWFNTFQTDGFLGDVMVVNFLYKPYADVRARKYRFRILDGAVSRYFKIALVDAAGKQVPFHLIANDGNILEHAVPFPNVESPEGLPEQSIGERYDIIVDFSTFKEGDKLYFANLLEHDNGKTPKRAVPLAEVLSGEYAKDGCPKSCDPAVGKFLEFRVHAMRPGAVDLSMNPADYEEGKKKMIPLPGFTPEELASATERTFSFNRGGDEKPWTISTDGGRSYNASSSSRTGGVYEEGVLNRLSAAPTRDSVEIWHIKNGGQGWAHPVHVHFEEGQILQRGGKAPPVWERWARKDMYRIGPFPESTDSVDIAIRVREFLGTYVEHCHNTQHEDNAMLLRWDSQNPGQTVAVQSPFPTWDGVTYVATDVTDVPTYKTGEQTDYLSKVADPVAENDAATTLRNTPVTIPVHANDTCIGGCKLTLLTSPAQGSATALADGSVIYAPAAGYSGTDSFTYRAMDNAVGNLSSLATVTVIVTSGVSSPAVSRPDVRNDTASTIQRTVVAINATANDANCTAIAPCTVAITSPPGSGTAVANSPGAGMVTYTPGGAFTGQDSLSYQARNTAGISATAATIAIAVEPNPVTDVVTIASNKLDTNGSLSVQGTVSAQNDSFAPRVEVLAGACPGASLGTAAVDQLGRWSFDANGVPLTTSSICVKSANGGAAQAALD